MSKVKLVLRPGEFSSFTTYYLQDFWREWFDVELYDETRTYERKGTVFVVWWLTMHRDDPWPAKMRDDGYHVAVDNLWEGQTFRTDFYWIEHKYSMYWNESLWWRALEYHNYIPNRKVEQIALLQLRTPKTERDTLIASLEHLLDRMLWSYTARNKKLPNDIDDIDQGQRYMHPSWYDHTYCSLVVETLQKLPLYVSEKSYKPLAYFHPFLSVSAPGTLAFLKQAGFETFDNIFDESYDAIDDFAKRVELIKQNLQGIDVRQNYDQLTQEKLQHNHELFFNESKVKDAMHREIILPLIEYADT
jgi:hypothetical protein